jgi:hypothetical protein
MIKTHLGSVGKKELETQPGAFVRGRRVDRGAIDKGGGVSTPDNKLIFNVKYGKDR